MFDLKNISLQEQEKQTEKNLVDDSLKGKKNEALNIILENERTGIRESRNSQVVPSTGNFILL